MAIEDILVELDIGEVITLTSDTNVPRTLEPSDCIGRTFIKRIRRWDGKGNSYTFESYYKYRCDPVPKTGKKLSLKNYWKATYKRPKTTQELRMNFASEPEYIRGKRKKKWLGSFWDDVPRSDSRGRNRSWKGYRKHRTKERGRTHQCRDWDKGRGSGREQSYRVLSKLMFEETYLNVSIEEEGSI